MPSCIEIPGYEAVFKSSNLPIIIIDTHGQEIPGNNPRIIAEMGVINNGSTRRSKLIDPVNGYRGKISIERRGESSAGWKKKQYDIETIDEYGNNNNVPLLGLPEENDWILNAPYIDKSFMRNVLIYHLSNEMGRYASRSRFFELVLNGEYMGIYVLLEKIKRDRNRVDISTLTVNDNEGDQLTGGYILRIDKLDNDYICDIDYFTSMHYQHPDFNKCTNYQFRYPERDVITTEQKVYIKNFIYKFEDVMASDYFADPDTGYYKYLDVSSFIDFIILNELAKNVDGYRLSTYMYKDRDSNCGKLTIGPIWDFNLGFGLANYYDGEDTDDWMIETLSNPKKIGKSDFMAQFWWIKLFREKNFSRQFYIRWQELRQNILSLDNVYRQIDSIAVTLNEAKDRNFCIWAAPGERGDGFWPVPRIFSSFETYQDEVDYLKVWLGNRIDWIDQNILAVTAIKKHNLISPKNFTLAQNYPNPFNPVTTIPYTVSAPAHIKMEIYNTLGQKVKTLVNTRHAAGHYNVNWDGTINCGQSAAGGMYLYRLDITGLNGENFSITKKMLYLK
ncbi:CotH kinase family protein [candidate division KSB1 bacterium]|nr:CotH kinase family protein [candidate division KSB1 bacterium]